MKRDAQGYLLCDGCGARIGPPYGASVEWMTARAQKPPAVVHCEPCRRARGDWS